MISVYRNLEQTWVFPVYVSVGFRLSLFRSAYCALNFLRKRHQLLCLYLFIDYVYPWLIPFLMPITQMSFLGSIFTTVALTLERYEFSINILRKTSNDKNNKSIIMIRYCTFNFIHNRYIAVVLPFFRQRHNLKAWMFLVPVAVFITIYR